MRSTYIHTGIFYLFANPILFKVIGPRVIPCIILSFAIIFILFFFLYIPHVALLVFFHGRWAFVQAVFMILNESALLISILCENFLLEESLVNMFDAVLLLKGYQELAEQGQEVDPLASNVVEYGFKSFSSLRSVSLFASRIHANQFIRVLCEDHWVNTRDRQI